MSTLLNFHYGYIIVFCCCLIMGVNIGLVMSCGGLGHLALQYAARLGAVITVFDITEDKRANAMKMGAAKFVNVRDSVQLKNQDNTPRVIISTIPAKYDLTMYQNMLKVDGDLVIVGLPAFDISPTISVTDLLMGGRRKIYGAQIGGICKTQEMLDYYIANNIYPQIEMISVDKIDEAYEHVLNGEVRYRYVLDMSTLK